MSGAHPNRVVVAGDWHGDTDWAVEVVEMLPDLLSEETEPVVVHVGDFGVWPGQGGADYLDEVTHALAAVNGRLLFVDGNHEDFTWLHHRRDQQGAWNGWPVPITDRITWLTRSTRWKWHNNWWVAVGGATSVDRALRREGISWWPEEEISESDHDRIVSLGPVDVMLCHDAPTSVPMAFGQWPPGWDIADRARADLHRDRVQAIVDEIRPKHLIHGHYHRYHEITVQNAHGDFTHVVGLDMNGGRGPNFRILDTRTMSWHPAIVPAA